MTTLTFEFADGFVAVAKKTYEDIDFNWSVEVEGFGSFDVLAYSLDTLYRAIEDCVGTLHHPEYSEEYPF